MAPDEHAARAERLVSQAAQIHAQADFAQRIERGAERA